MTRQSDSSTSDSWRVDEALAWGSQYLRRSGVESAITDAALLLAYCMGWPKERLYLCREEQVPALAAAAYRALVRRRGNREPVAYLVGRREFMSLEFGVDSRVLIPRPETELLVEEALTLLGATAGSSVGGQGGTHVGAACVGREAPANVGTGSGDAPRVADVGTGSGAVAVAVAYYRPHCLVVASDADPQALEVAGANARRHGVADRVVLTVGEGLEPLRPWVPFRGIICNPPYVAAGEEVDEEVRRYEPRQAWCGGEDALAFYRMLGAEAPSLLEEGGFLAVEVGRGQAAAVAEVFERQLAEVRIRNDLAGVPRVVVGRKG